MAEKYLVEGYEFDSIEDANTAKKELEAVKYLSKKTSEGTPMACLKIYNKIVEQNMFRTPIGLDFLSSLEEYLLQNGLFDVPDISAEESEQAAMTELSMQKAEKEQMPHDSAKNNEETESTNKEEKNIKENKKEKKKAKKNKPEKKKADESTLLKRTKEKLVMSLILNGILIICVGAMIYIASTSSNVNILNYETALKDKYATWSEDLKDKEEKIKQREKAVTEREKAVEARENEQNKQDEEDKTQGEKQTEARVN